MPYIRRTIVVCLSALYNETFIYLFIYFEMQTCYVKQKPVHVVVSEYAYIPDAEQTTMSAPDSATNDAGAAAMTASGVVISGDDRQDSANSGGSSTEDNELDGFVYELAIRNGSDGNITDNNDNSY
jgi:hypothetical protein